MQTANDQPSHCPSSSAMAFETRDRRKIRSVEMTESTLEPIHEIFRAVKKFGIVELKSASGWSGHPNPVLCFSRDYLAQLLGSGAGLALLLDQPYSSSVTNTRIPTQTNQARASRSNDQSNAIPMMAARVVSLTILTLSTISTISTTASIGSKRIRQNCLAW